MELLKDVKQFIGGVKEGPVKIDESNYYVVIKVNSDNLDMSR